VSLTPACSSSSGSGVDDRFEVPEVPRVDRDLCGDHDLLLVDRGLGVIALEVAARGLQQPRVGIGQVHLALRNLGR